MELVDNAETIQHTAMVHAYVCLELLESMLLIVKNVGSFKRSERENVPACLLFSRCLGYVSVRLDPV